MIRFVGCAVGMLQLYTLGDLLTTKRTGLASLATAIVPMIRRIGNIVQNVAPTIEALRCTAFVLAAAGVLEATAGVGALAVGEATRAAEVQVGGGAEVVGTAGDRWKVHSWF